MRYALILLAFIAAPVWGQMLPEQCEKAYGARPAEIAGVAFAITGDTIAMYVDGKRRSPTIKLAGVLAPSLYERATGLENPLGMESRAGLEQALFDMVRDIKCFTVDYDELCRVVARCGQPVPGKAGTPPMFNALSLTVLHGGWARADVNFVDSSSEASALFHMERDARRERRGLWRVWLPAEQR